MWSFMICTAFLTSEGRSNQGGCNRCEGCDTGARTETHTRFWRGNLKEDYYMEDRTTAGDNTKNDI